MLNERGGYESDFTVTMLDHDEYMVVTGSAQAVRDRDVIERALATLPVHLRCTVVDVTSMSAVIAVMGPLSRAAAAARIDRGFLVREFPLRHLARDRLRLRNSAGDPTDLCRRARMGALRSGGVRGRCLRGTDGSGP